MPVTYVEFDLTDFDDEEIIDHMEARGYKVVEEDDVEYNDEQDPLLTEIFWRYDRGDLEDALILLERRFPELHGISRKVKV